MPIFSVGVKTTLNYPNAYSYLNAYSVIRRRAEMAYIVEAKTDKKAKNAVGRYLKSIGKQDSCDVLDAIPAEYLPATAREAGLVAHRERQTFHATVRKQP